MRQMLPMVKILSKYLRIIFILCISFKAQAQDLCTPVGWVTQNGGVTGGGAATATVVTNYNDLKTAITSSSVKVVHISGTITIPSAGRISFQDQSAKTVYGLPGSKLVSNDLTKDGSGIFNVKRCSNIIFRNLTFVGPAAYDTDGWDNMVIDNCTNVWVDHCEFQDGMDGNLDIKNASDYISVTWCKFIYNKAPIPDGPGGSDDHRFSNLFGSSDGATGDRGKLRITLQNCWWAQGCKMRMPRVRFGKVHVVNNYFSSTVASSCVMAGFEADLLVESNVFENVGNPIDKMDGTYTAITSKNNIFTSTSGNTSGDGTSFTPPYSLTVASASDVKSKVSAGAGAVLTSPTCNGTVNKLPTVGITAPTTNTVYTAPASSITLSATAADADGTVSKVEFYNGTTLLGSDNSSPYSYNWTNVAAGTYTITAKATDDKGGVTTSSAITVIVNQPPVVSITSPANNASFVAPASITINATASDADGNISKVEFYNGTTLLGSDNTSSYSYSWTNVAAGTYAITAKATDNNGAVTTSTAVTITVAANQLPTVSITAPTTNTVYTAPASSITLSATAADIDGTVSKVEFYNGTTLLGSDNSSPYSYSWTNVAAGTYTITAIATDNKGGVTTSSAVTVIVNQPPVVSITSPANNTSFVAPASITINATASDANGNISKVEFYNGTTLLGSDNTSSYSYSWTNVFAGTYTITAKATDNNGAVTASTAITITVAANQLPTVSITAPTTNTVYTAPASSITLSATAADADGTVSKVEFYNGTTLLGSDNSSPYSYSWTNVAAGTYTITAKATDNKGGVTTSSAVTVIVNQPPVVSVTSPANNASFVAPASITINATASDADGNISKVEFYNGTTLLGSDNTSSYSYSWTNVPAGTYTITAQAIDNHGAVTTSSAITVKVNTNQPSVVVINSPVNNSSFNAPANVNIGVTATDADGSITKVEFYNGNTLLGSSSSSPYVFSWDNVAAGTYTITVKVTDSNGGVTVSSPVTITVVAPNQLPSVAITSPVNNAIILSNTDINIQASASDADGDISKVEFYNGNMLLLTDESAPYECAWSNISVGTYSLTAKAIDNKGGVTTSDVVTITVEANKPSLITFVSPADNDEVEEGSSVTIEITASDPDGSINKVEFYDGAILIGTVTSQPYVFEWHEVSVGNHAITAKVTDSNGGVTSSSVIALNVNSKISGLLSSHYGKLKGVYPNPSNSSFMIESVQDIAKLYVMDIYGKRVIEMNGVFREKEVGNELEVGTYVLVIQYATGQSAMTRIVKVK